MLKLEQVPDEVVRAYWHDITYGSEDVRGAIAAAINAWPGMWVEQLYPLPVRTYGAILPLPAEARDE